MTKTIREMIDEHRASPIGGPPDSLGTIAERIGISRMHLYNLFHGRCKASEWTVVRIARVLELNPSEVRAALQAAREEALQS